MEKNKIILKDKNGNKNEYRILLTIETNNNKNYILYTNDIKNNKGNSIVYVNSYVLSEKGNMTKFKDLEESEYELIDNILSSLEV